MSERERGVESIRREESVCCDVCVELSKSLRSYFAAEGLGSIRCSSRAAAHCIGSAGAPEVSLLLGSSAAEQFFTSYEDLGTCIHHVCQALSAKRRNSLRWARGRVGSRGTLGMIDMGTPDTIIALGASRYHRITYKSADAR